jgi:hypothetical protein
MPQEKAERRIDHMIKGGLVEPARDGFLVVERLRVEPGGDLGFDLRAARPAEECVVTVGTNPCKTRCFADCAGRTWPQRTMPLKTQMPWRLTILLIVLAVLIAALGTAAIRILVEQLS